MSRFPSLQLILKFRRARAGLVVLCLAAFTMLPRLAMCQTFSLSLASFNFDAVDPGGTDSANVTVNGSGVTVSLSCTATPQQAVTVLPSCTVSPSSVDAPGSTVVTFNTVIMETGCVPSPSNSCQETASAGLYLITVTGTAGSTTQTQSQYLTVLSVAAQYTITIATPMNPTTVAAGLSSNGTVSVNPLNGYKGQVTLSCASISPLVVVFPPYCSFNPPFVTVDGAPMPSTLTIKSTGPASVPPNPGTSRSPAPGSLGFWLAVPTFAFAGLGAAAGGKRSRKAWFLIAFFVLAASALLMPACNSVTTTPLSGNQSGGTTPNNTYTFTLTGIDTLGNPASNTGSSSASPTVTLTVN
jgi:hypothetical protein